MKETISIDTTTDGCRHNRMKVLVHTGFMTTPFVIHAPRTEIDNDTRETIIDCLGHELDRIVPEDFYRITEDGRAVPKRWAIRRVSAMMGAFVREILRGKRVYRIFEIQRTYMRRRSDIGQLTSENIVCHRILLNPVRVALVGLPQAYRESYGVVVG